MKRVLWYGARPPIIVHAQARTHTAANTPQSIQIEDFQAHPSRPPRLTQHHRINARSRPHQSQFQSFTILKAHNPSKFTSNKPPFQNGIDLATSINHEQCRRWCSWAPLAYRRFFAFCLFDDAEISKMMGFRRLDRRYINDRGLKPDVNGGEG